MASTDKEALQSERLVSLLDRVQAAPSAYWRAKLADIDVGSITSIPRHRPPAVHREVRSPRVVPLRHAGNLARRHRAHPCQLRHQRKPTVVGYSRRDIDIFAECNARALAIAGVIRVMCFTTPMATDCSRAASAFTTAASCSAPPSSRPRAATPGSNFSSSRTWAPELCAPRPRFACSLASEPPRLDCTNASRCERRFSGRSRGRRDAAEDPRRVGRGIPGGRHLRSVRGHGPRRRPGVTRFAGSAPDLRRPFLPRDRRSGDGRAGPGPGSSASWSSPPSPRRRSRCFATGPATSQGSSPSWARMAARSPASLA